MTGCRGSLGTEVCIELERNNIDLVRFSQFMSLGDIKWDQITHVVNCAAVIPNQNVTLELYWEGNVKFVTELLKYATNKHFIHFSSLSEQYKFDDYQITKLLGSNLLSCNGHVFASLQIIPVPTLEDIYIISDLINKSKSEKVTVDRLKYSFLQVNTLAILIIESIKKNERCNVINYFIEKDLFDEVKKGACLKNLIEGPIVDRISVKNQLITFSTNLLTDISKKSSIC